MLTVGTLVIPGAMREAQAVCSLDKEVAELWVKKACMRVNPQNTTEWLQTHSLQAIVVQSKGYAVVVIDHWGKDNYRLVEIPQM